MNFTIVATHINGQQAITAKKFLFILYEVVVDYALNLLAEEEYDQDDHRVNRKNDD